MKQIWWSYVPSALRFITDICGSLLEDRSVILHSTRTIPWHEDMTQAILDAIQPCTAYKRFDTAADIDEPGAYLLRTYCDPNRRTAYRPTKSYARFFADNDDIGLHQLFLWVHICTVEQMEAWAQFVSEYTIGREHNREKAVFLLEWSGTEPMKCQKGVQRYSLDSYIYEYDKIVFCTLASSSIDECDLLRKYLTELAVHCAGDDMELCNACLKHYEDFLKAPWDTICQIISDELRSDGSTYDSFKSRDEIGHLTWLAQIRTIYPALEEYREQFVEKYADIIASQLPIESSYGEVYDHPNDVELGTLKFMADSGSLRLKQKEYDRLTLYKEARNKLSHLTPLTSNEICNLIS